MEALISFETFDFSVRFGLPHNHLVFHYFQICSTIKSHCSTFHHLPSQDLLDDILERPHSFPGLVSKLYKHILTHGDCHTNKIRSLWGNEMRVTFQDTWWEKAIFEVNHLSSCAHLNLIQFKVLHRMYLRTARLAKYTPKIQPQIRQRWDYMFEIEFKTEKKIFVNNL